MRWETHRLEDVLDMYQPKTLAKKHFKNGPFKVYGANGIIGAHDEFNHEEREVVLGCRGSCGEVHLTEPHSWINGNAMVMRPKDSSQLSQEFLFKALEGGVDTTKAITGSAQPQITRKSLNPLCIPIPPLEEQERIVEVLDEAFAAIDKAKANAERNLTNARELFQSRLNDIFSNPSKDWEVKPLGEVFELENGDRGKNYPKPTDLTDDGVPWVNAGDLREGLCEVTTAKHITTAAFDKLSRGKFKSGDVLFCLRGSLGKFGQVRNGDFGAIASSLVIIKASSSLDSRYLSQWLNCRSCKNQIDEYAGGAAQPNLGAKDLGRFRFPLPSHEKKSTIVEHLELMGNEVKMLEAKYRTELDNLEELRQSILEEAFEGKLTEPVAA